MERDFVWQSQEKPWTPAKSGHVTNGKDVKGRVSYAALVDHIFCWK